jgi:multidrug efflux system outer membrane protein
MKILLQAFSEVEQSLATENSINRQYKSILEAEQQSQAAYNLAVGRYEKGISDLITVLNSQQQLFSAKSQKYSLQNQRIRSRVNLFLALGGDFDISKN